MKLTDDAGWIDAETKVEDAPAIIGESVVDTVVSAYETVKEAVVGSSKKVCCA